VTYDERQQAGQALRDAAYVIYAEVGRMTKEAKKLWREGDLLRQEWILKEGREVHRAKHFCPEPEHAAGALWFDYWYDVPGSSDWITCPNCDKTVPITRVYTLPHEECASNTQVN